MTAIAIIFTTLATIFATMFGWMTVLTANNKGWMRFAYGLVTATVGMFIIWFVVCGTIYMTTATGHAITAAITIIPPVAATALGIRYTVKNHLA